MNTYAIVNSSTNTVDNVVIWDGTAYNSTTHAGWQVPSGHTAINLAGIDPTPSIGWTYVGGVWSPGAPIQADPDVQGFTVAIITSASITSTEKGYLLGALAALKDEIALGNNVVTEAGWLAIKNSGDISSTAINAILTLAPAYNIPIS